MLETIFMNFEWQRRIKDVVTRKLNGSSKSVQKQFAAAFSIQGKRLTMEDRFVIEENIDDMSIFAVFDGHGSSMAAQYIKDNLPLSLCSKIRQASKYCSNDLKLKEIIKNHILDVDEKLMEKTKKFNVVCGTTATIAVIFENKLIIMNIGDSRAIMADCYGRAVALTQDHKPQELKELARIREAGGFITFRGVWRVGGVLGVSRAFGDYILKEKNMIIADPDIKIIDLIKEKPKFLIIASDGLFDAISSEETVRLVKKYKSIEPVFGAKRISLKAISRGSSDNITVIIVDFTKRINKA